MRKVTTVVKSNADIKSANGKIVATGEDGYHRKVHVVYFTESKANKILDAVDRVNLSF